VEERDFYSVDQVAELLGLHGRTVRTYVRDGRLKAVRIGRQYRIARSDLHRFTGESTRQSAQDSTDPIGPVEVSSIVHVEAISPSTAHRLVSAVMAAIGQRAEQDRLRVESIYDEERARLRLVVLGTPSTTADVLILIQTLTGADS
jgi:excisionase family DNA binding protein